MAPKHRSDGWRVEEDEALCEARLIFGSDPVFGINQRESTMWEKIHEHFEANRPTGGLPRDQKSCSVRWKKINKECMMYSAALMKAQQCRASSTNNTNEELLAESNYQAVAKKPFRLKHCWELLKNEPKYQNPPSNESVVNLDNDDDDKTPRSGAGGSSSTRPVGQKSKKSSNQKEHGNSKRMEDYLAYAKARDAQRTIERAKEWEEAKAFEQNAEDRHTMQVDPNIFTPNKKRYWEMKQKVIIDREMADAYATPSSPPMNAGLVRNLFSSNDTQWFGNLQDEEDED